MRFCTINLKKGCDNVQNFIKTIINGVQKWTKKEIKNSTADWNQNDPTVADYVKNRTHWEENEVLLERSEFDFQFEASIDRYNCKIYNPPEFFSGDILEIFWDNSIYHCVVEQYGERCRIGFDDDTVPFRISVYETMMDVTVKDYFDSSVHHTIGIVRENIHKLDSKYLDLPTNLATTDDVQEAVDVANEAQNTANEAQNTANGKMDASNPVGTGSFSMNRIANSTVGSNSFTLGKNNKAQGQYSGALGEGIIANHNNVLVSGRYNKKDWSKYRGGYGSRLTVSFGYSFTDWKYNDSLNAFELIGVSSSKTSYGDAKIGKKYAFKIYTSTEGIIYTNEFAHVLSKTYETYSGGNKSVRLSAYIYTSKTGYRSTYAHIVGNGTSDTERSNAHTLDWEGVGWFQGGLQVGGNAQDDGAKSVLLEGDAIPIPENATVGQTIAVKSVDENGKPVEWEATDFSASGGSGCIASDIAPEDTSVLWIDTADNSDDTLQDAVNIALAQAKESGEFKGDPGKTPEKGVDYYTDTDKAELVSAVLSALPAWTGGSY